MLKVAKLYITTEKYPVVKHAYCRLCSKPIQDGIESVVSKFDGSLSIPHR